MPTIDQSKLTPEITDTYFVKDNTFFAVEKYNPMDLVEKEIGDSKQAEFYPQQKITRWDNEVNFSARLVHDELTPTVSTLEDKIVWDGEKVAVNFYDLPIDDKNPEGASEFEVILKEKPKTNIVSFTLETKGLDFFYQPFLKNQNEDGSFWEEDENGGIGGCPENVAGSYAVYASENKTNYVGGKEYKCGKVGHIYRPRIEDAVGSWVWGEMNVDIEKGILSVTIPQEFLDKAVYPVRHAAGLTFGYTSLGAAIWTQIAGYSSDDSNTVGSNFNLGGAGNITKMSVGLNLSDSSGNLSTNLFLAVYREDSAGANSHDLVASAENLGVTITKATTPSWYEINFASESLTADDYILAALADGGALVGNGNINFWRDATTPTRRIYMEYTSGAGSYATRKAENPWGNTDSANDRQLSIYATYTAGGGASGPANLKTYNTNPIANIKSINTNLIANCKSLNTNV